MKRVIVATAVAYTLTIFASILPTQSAYAASEAECGIWLCLPAGFPSSCGPSKSAWKKRIKKGKPPLPAFASCSNGGSGSYEMGVERFHPCPSNTVALDGFDYYRNKESRRCISQSCITEQPGIMNRLEEGFPTPPSCQISYAPPRDKTHFIKMWMDGEFAGQYFYQ